jgi:hypothetical protein
MNEFRLPKKFNWELASQPIIKKYVADLFQQTTSSTSGLLVVGTQYIINTVEVGDNFTNVGYIGAGVPFIATGTTPTTWTNGTIVVDYKLSTPVATVLANNTEVAFSYEYIDAGVYYVTSSKPIFTGCGMGCPIGQHTQVTITNGLGFFLGTGAGIIVFPTSDTQMVILTSDSLSGLVDDILGGVTQNALEVTIYPQS